MPAIFLGIFGTFLNFVTQVHEWNIFLIFVTKNVIFFAVGHDSQLPFSFFLSELFLTRLRRTLLPCCVQLNKEAVRKETQSNQSWLHIFFLSYLMNALCLKQL